MHISWKVATFTEELGENTPNGVRSSDLLSFKERLFPRLANIPTEKPMPIDKLSDSRPESAGQEGYRGEGWEGRGNCDSGFV